jgi:SNF2 family DNA or RNA helicase
LAWRCGGGAGIGKSVEALALVLAHPRPCDERTSPLGTLIVCPTTLLANWKAECDKLLPKRLRVLVLNSAAKKTMSAKAVRAHARCPLARTRNARHTNARHTSERLASDDGWLVDWCESSWRPSTSSSQATACST